MITPDYFADGDPIQLDALAREQFSEWDRLFVPGLAFSDIPARIVVPVDLHPDEAEILKSQGIGTKPVPDWRPVYLGNLWRHTERWSEIPAHIHLRLGEIAMVSVIPPDWSFAGLIPPGAKPHPFDLANPRHYRLDGRQFPWFGNGSDYARSYLDHFKSLFMELFLQTPPNMQPEFVLEFLDHHSVNGHNRAAFLDCVEGIYIEWKSHTPRVVGSAHGLGSSSMLIPVPNARLLLRAMEKWLQFASSSPVVAPKAKPTKPWPDLKSLALFYAYRWEVEGKAVDFTTIDKANAIAAEAGHKSGKTLLEHYRRYTMGEPENRRIERTKEGGRPGDVLKRFDTVVAKLAPYPPSLPLAQAEHAIVRTRTTERKE